MAPTAGITSNGGAVGITAGGNITLASVDAGSGALAIQSSSGRIGTATPGVNNVTAGELTLNAASGIELAYIAPQLHVSNANGNIALANSVSGLTVSSLGATDSSAIAQTIATVSVQQTIASAQTGSATTAVVLAPVSTAASDSSASSSASASSTASSSSTSSSNASSSSSSGTATSESSSSSGNAASGSESKEKQAEKSAGKTGVQTVTVATTTVQKPADQVLQVERPKGQMLMCR